MNKIIDFLQSQSGSDNISGHKIDEEKLSKSFDDLKNIIGTPESDEKRILKLKSKPKIKKGQIWLCKQKYYDALGNQIIGSIPYLVVIIGEVESIVDESFIRIQSITPFTEFKSEDEILVNNNSIVGFDFKIETWNEQPILTSLLDEFVGNLDIDLLKVDEPELSLSNSQKEFRKAEIKNTAYLRQSVNSFIEFQENQKENSVFINVNNTVHFPESKNTETNTTNLINEPTENYLLAAKRGSLFDRPTYSFKNIAEYPELNVIVIKDNDNYIISVKNTTNVEIRDSKGYVLKQASKNVYDGLSQGLYFVKIIEENKEFRIILK